MVWAWEGPNDVLGSPPALTVPLVDLGHQSRAEQSIAVPSVLIPGGVHTDDPLARLACGNRGRALPAGVQLWARQGMLVCVGQGLGSLFLL